MVFGNLYESICVYCGVMDIIYDIYGGCLNFFWIWKCVKFVIIELEFKFCVISVFWVWYILMDLIKVFVIIVFVFIILIFVF